MSTGADPENSKERGQEIEAVWKQHPLPPKTFASKVVGQLFFETMVPQASAKSTLV